MAHSSDDLADHCGLHLISMRSPTFPSLCISTLRSSCSWGFWRNPEHHLLHQTEKVAALKSLMHWRAVKSLSCKGTAPHPAVPGWLRLGVPAKPSWGCLGVRELCNGQHTPGRWQRHPCVHRGMTRGAGGENSKRLQNKTVSKIPVLHWSESGIATQVWPGYLHQHPPSCKTSPQHHTGHQNRAQFKGENKCDWKRRRTIKSISRHPCPACGGWHRWAQSCSSFCCSSIIILLWQLLMDRLFCYLAKFSLKQLSPIHEYIHTCIDTHLGTVPGTIQAWSKAQLQSSHTRLMSGCLLTALQLQNPVLTNDFSKPCCTKENRFNLYISA